MHMGESFSKVHGIEHDNSNYSKVVKCNVVNKVENHMSKTVAQQYNEVTGFSPGGRVPGDEKLDDLQVFFDQLQHAGNEVSQSLHKTQVDLNLANPCIVKFV